MGCLHWKDKNLAGIIGVDKKGGLLVSPQHRYLVGQAIRKLGLIQMVRHMWKKCPEELQGDFLSNVSPDEIYDMLEAALSRLFTSSELEEIMHAEGIPVRLSEEASIMKEIVNNFFYSRLVVLEQQHLEN